MLARINIAELMSKLLALHSHGAHGIYTGLLSSAQCSLSHCASIENARAGKACSAGVQCDHVNASPLLELVVAECHMALCQCIQCMVSALRIISP